MAVVITVEITYYTWDTAPFTWEETGKTWDNMGKQAFSLDKTASIALTDKGHKALAKPQQETLDITDGFKKHFAEMVTEALKLSEVYWDNISFFLHVLESITVKEKGIKKLGKEAFENFSLTDDSWRGIGKRPKEKITLADRVLHEAVFARAFYDVIHLDEKPIKHPNLKKYAAFGLDDLNKISKSLELLSKEEIALADELAREWIARRLFNENISTTDFLKRNIQVVKSEKLEVFDALLEACGGVLSNILISEGTMSEDDFADAVATPPGYTPFVDFKVGEYEYEEALVRIILQNQVLQTQPSVTGVIMHVDIPDTDDRGTVVITSTDAPTRVYYNKFYYNPPEVACTLLGGSTADGYVAPNILTTEGNDEFGRYFEVELINSFGQRVTGSITWVSKGY